MANLQNAKDFGKGIVTEAEIQSKVQLHAPAPDLANLSPSRFVLPSTAPSSPAVGTLYYDTAEYSIRQWNGNEWVALANQSKGMTSDNPFTSWAEINAAGAVLFEADYWVQFADMSSAVQVTISPNRAGDGGKNVIRIVQGVVNSAPYLNLWDSIAVNFRRVIVQRTDESLTGWAVASSNIYCSGSGTGTGGVSVSSAYTSDVKIILHSFDGGFGIYRNNQTSCSWSSTNSGAIGAGYDGSCVTAKWGTGNNSGPHYDNISGDWSIWIGED